MNNITLEEFNCIKFKLKKNKKEDKKIMWFMIFLTSYFIMYFITSFYYYNDYNDLLMISLSTFSFIVVPLYHVLFLYKQKTLIKLLFITGSVIITMFFSLETNIKILSSVIVFFNVFFIGTYYLLKSNTNLFK